MHNLLGISLYKSLLNKRNNFPQFTAYGWKVTFIVAAVTATFIADITCYWQELYFYTIMIILTKYFVMPY